MPFILWSLVILIVLFLIIKVFIHYVLWLILPSLIIIGVCYYVARKYIL